MKTYTLFLQRGNAPPEAFEPVLCESDADALGRARRMLDEQPDFDTVRVSFGDDLLFLVGRSRMDSSAGGRA